LELGEALDKTKNKVVQVIKASKYTAQGTTTETSNFSIIYQISDFRNKKIINADDINIITHYNNIA